MLSHCECGPKINDATWRELFSEIVLSFSNNWSSARLDYCEDYISIDYIPSGFAYECYRENDNLVINISGFNDIIWEEATINIDGGLFDNRCPLPK